MFIFYMKCLFIILNNKWYSIGPAASSRWLYQEVSIDMGDPQ